MKVPVIILLVWGFEVKTDDFFFQNGMHLRLPDDEIENLAPKRFDVNFTVKYSYPFKNIYDLVEEKVTAVLSLNSKITRHNFKLKIHYIKDRIGLGKEEQYFRNYPINYTTIKFRTRCGFLTDELRSQIILKTPDSPENVYIKTCSGVDILQYQKFLSIIVMDEDRAEITDRTFICGKLQRTVIRLEHLNEFDIKSNLSFHILDYEMNHPMKHLIINNYLTLKIDARNLYNIQFDSKSDFEQNGFEEGPVKFNIPLDYVDEIEKNNDLKNGNGEILKSDSTKEHSNLGKLSTNEKEKNSTISDETVQIESYNVFWFLGEVVETYDDEDEDAEYEQSGSGDYASGSGNSDIIESRYDTIDEDKHYENDNEMEKMLLEDLLQPYNHKKVVESFADGSGSGSGDVHPETDMAFTESSGLIDDGNHKKIIEGVEGSADGSGSGSGDLFFQRDTVFRDSSVLIGDKFDEIMEKADRVSNEIYRRYKMGMVG